VIIAERKKRVHVEVRPLKKSLDLEKGIVPSIKLRKLYLFPV
jgi:hypothetical protein